MCASNDLVVMYQLYHKLHGVGTPNARSRLSCLCQYVPSLMLFGGSPSSSRENFEENTYLLSDDATYSLWFDK